MKKTENMFLLADTFTVTNFVFNDYISPKPSSAGLCSLTYADKFSFAPVPIGLIFPRNSTQLRDQFNVVIGELVESGLLVQATARKEEQVDLVTLCQQSQTGLEKTLQVRFVYSNRLIILVNTLDLTAGRSPTWR